MSVSVRTLIFINIAFLACYIFVFYNFDMSKEKGLEAKYRGRGSKGESRVRSRLNPMYSKNPVEHRYIENLILMDNFNHSHQIDHIEIRHNGIFCIETKNFAGEIYGDENSDTWVQDNGKYGRRTFLNPLKQNKTHCCYISKVLNDEHIINSVVVFILNNADKVRCNNVVNLNDLRDYLDKFNNGTYLSIEEIDYIYNTLLNAASDLSKEEHAKNVKNRFY